MRTLILLAALLAACAPVRESGENTLPPRDDDASEPDDSASDAFELGNGGSFTRFVCPGDEDWLSFQLADFGYAEVYIERPGTWDSLVELQDADGNVLDGSAQQGVASFWMTRWEPGSYFIRLAQDRSLEREVVNLNAYIGDDIVVGDLGSF